MATAQEGDPMAESPATATATTTPADAFQTHAPTDAATCDCPIHADRAREPFTAPLGMAFADAVHVEPIPERVAAAVYDAHHGYMDGTPLVNLTHHGLYFRGALVGAVTWRYPLLAHKRIHFDDGGRLVSPPLAIDDLPAPIRPTARRVLSVEHAHPARSEVVSGGAFLEAARICIGVPMPNLASASLARSQQRVVWDHAASEGIRYLRTLVRADFDAAMIRALRDKGWTCVGWSEPSQAGNRAQTPIRERYKWQFLCPVERVGEQMDLGRWADG